MGGLKTTIFGTLAGPERIVRKPMTRVAAFPTILLCCCLAGIAVSGWSQAIETSKSRLSDLADMSLEDLTKIEVTSVSKHKEKLTDAPAAIAVITQEDIRRSGVTTIAEALRLAPGLEVARVDAHDWAISSRGFNELYANKLLVVIDGRSV